MKPKRKMRTDAEKEALIREASPIGKGELAPWCRSKGLTDSWFRRMRKIYLAEHPHFNPAEAPPQNLPALRHEAPPISFKLADTATKRRLIAEYDRLPFEEKTPWRDRHKCSGALITYYRKALKMPLNMQYSRNKPAPAPPLATDDPTQSLLEQYASLQGNGMKSIFLKKYGLNHQQLWEAKNRGKSLAKILERKKAKAALPRISNGHAALPIPVISRPVPTLDDAINALEVKRDNLSAVIEDLKRMRG